MLEIRLLDLSGGQQGPAQVIEILPGQQQIPINLDDFNAELATGFYLLHIVSGSNLFMKKIIVSR